MPAMKPVIKSIEVNEDVHVKNEILPYEVLEKYMSVYEIFSESPCSCRESRYLSLNRIKLIS